MNNDLTEFFKVSEKNFSKELELKEKLEKFAQAFLKASRVNTEIDPARLEERLENSEIPVKPCEPDDYFQFLLDSFLSHSINTASPTYIGHMTSALPYFVRPLQGLVTLLNQNLVKVETSKSIAPLERQALAIMHRLIYGRHNKFYKAHIQNHSSTLGIVTSGGTVANITALWCACHYRFQKKGNFSGIGRDGLLSAIQAYGYNGVVIIGSELLHYSFRKAVDLLGIGQSNLILIPVNHRHQVNIKLLKKAVQEAQARNNCILAIVGIAGTTDSGSVDPLKKIGEIARAVNTHFHVDAAWGGPTLFSRQNGNKLSGIDLADSVTVDGHKQLYLPMGMGMLILRDPHLAKHLEINAPYAVRENSADLGRRSLEGSRPATILLLQAGLHLLGQRGYADLIDEGIRKAAYLASIIKLSPEFELLIEPTLNIVLYRYIPEFLRKKAVKKALSDSEQIFINQFNQRLQVLQHQSGRTFVSRTILRSTMAESHIPLVALRAVLANPVTTEKHILSVLKDQKRIVTHFAKNWSLGNDTAGELLSQLSPPANAR